MKGKADEPMGDSLPVPLALITNKGEGGLKHGNL